MFTQSQFFKTIAFLGLFFIPLRTLLAIAPKTGAGFTNAYGAPYPEGWDAYDVGLVCFSPIAIFFAWKFILGLIKLNSDQKQSRYDQ